MNATGHLPPLPRPNCGAVGPHACGATDRGWQRSHWPQKRNPETPTSDLQECADRRLKTLGEGSDYVSFPLVASRQPKLLVRMQPGHCIYLQNSDTEESTIKAGTLIAGFGKVHSLSPARKNKGKKNKDVEDDTEDKREVKEVPYRLEDSNTTVMLNSQLATVGSALQQQQATDPKAKIAYFEMVPAPVESDNNAMCNMA